MVGISTITPGVIAVVRNSRLSTTCQVAATLVTLYDHFLSIEKEVHYVWKKRWTVSKGLYIWTRYLGDFGLLWQLFFILHPNPTRQHGIIYSCIGGFQTTTWTSCFTLWAVQVTLQLRIFAMYGNSWKPLLVTGIFFLAEIGVMCFITITSALRTHSHPVPFAGVTLCVPNNIPSYSYLFYVPIFITELSLFAFAAKKCLQHMQEIRDMNNWTRSSVTNVLLRDNIGYFFATTVTYAAVMAVWLTQPPTSFQIPVCFANAATTVMGARLVLNLAQAYHAPHASAASGWGTEPHIHVRHPRSRSRGGAAGAGTGTRTRERAIEFADIPLQSVGRGRAPGAGGGGGGAGAGAKAAEAGDAAALKSTWMWDEEAAPPGP